jgi:hypothetical protein
VPGGNQTLAKGIAVTAVEQAQCPVYEAPGQGDLFAFWNAKGDSELE